MADSVNARRNESVCFLLDNGSLRAESTLSLRRIASELSQRLGRKIHAVSLLHSSKVDPSELEGEKAWTFVPALKHFFNQGYKSFEVLPLFFGPSRAFTEYLPERVKALEADYPELSVSVMSPLFQQGDLSAKNIAGILKDNIGRVRADNCLEEYGVVMVDHGTPVKEVNDVRNAVGQCLEAVLDSSALYFSVASMERREGQEYDFNEPLLEHVLQKTADLPEHVIISLLFLNPGRHAGEGGDIATICETAKTARPNLKTFMTPLVGQHPDLIDLLEARMLEQAE